MLFSNANIVLLVVSSIIFAVSGDRVGDYNVYTFDATSTDIYPRCRVKGCKATSPTSMCSASYPVNAESWQLTEMCSANRMNYWLLSNSRRSENNLTMDILLNSDVCNSHGLKYTTCAKMNDLNSNGLKWVTDTNSGYNCRNCPICECFNPLDSSVDEYYPEWRYDTTSNLLSRVCIRCQCTNNSAALFSNTPRPVLSDSNILGGWNCQISKQSSIYSVITDSNWYCNAPTLNPTMQPTTDPIPRPQPTYVPTSNPTSNPTFFCEGGNYTIGDYYFDNLHGNCMKFCLCESPQPYCQEGYDNIANDTKLQQGFFQNCGRYVTECYTNNATRDDLFRAVLTANANCSADIDKNNIGSSTYWNIMCPRCPCSFSNHAYGDPTWKGSYVRSRIYDTTVNKTISYYNCPQQYECVNDTGFTQSPTYFIQIKSGSPVNNPGINQSDPSVCIAPTHYCMSRTAVNQVFGTTTMSYDTAQYNYDYCQWYNTTSKRTSTICLLNQNVPTSSPTTVIGNYYQPVNDYGIWGPSMNWICEAFLNASGASGGKKCWNQKEVWTSEVFDCFNQEFIKESIETTVRFQCCSAYQGPYCNNQTITEGSNNCGSNDLLGKYVRTMWERQYGNRGQWSVEQMAYRKCGDVPGVNRSVADLFINNPKASEVGCSYLKSYYMENTQTQCDTFKILQDSGKLTKVNAKKMWSQFSNSFWSSNHRSWYNHWNCTWNNYKETGYNYPPKALYDAGIFGCVDFGFGHRSYETSLISKIITGLFLMIIAIFH